MSLSTLRLSSVQLY